MSTLKKDVQTGRLLIIDLNNPPDITAEEFMQYIHEGFVPVVKVPRFDPQSGRQYIHFIPGPVEVNSEGVVTCPSNAVAAFSLPVFFFPEGMVIQSITEGDDTSGGGGSGDASSDIA